MQELERPYDQKEYEASWQEASRQRQKERHMEGREGRTKSIALNGFEKSYLEVHQGKWNTFLVFSSCFQVFLFH